MILDNDESDEEEGGGKKVLSLAQKRILEQERETAIAQYRIQKQRIVAQKLAAYESKIKKQKK